jgi:pyruvate/2-oxoacid:ferredoxin oxidoreductase alpha subunit
MVKGGGHGNYRNIVLAPASVQEMAELTMLAFDLADKYRNPAVVLADGFTGQMMEPLDLEDREIQAPEKPWAVKGTPETRANLISSIYLETDELENHERKLEAKYIRAKEAEQRWELCHTEDADVLLVGYGIVSRVLLSTIEALRKEGVKAGLFRPITLWPYPSEALAKAAAKVQKVLVVELSNGQMVEDVRLALNGKVPVEFYGRVGGNVPSVTEMQQQVMERIAVAV